MQKKPDTINGRTPEEIKKGLECRERVYLKTCGFVCEECDCFVPPYSVANRYADALAYIQQLERERDEARKDLDTINYANTELYSAYDAMKRERDAAVEAMFLKPLSWDEAIGDDAFLEIKGDEYIDAALNRFACSRDVGANQNGFIYYTTLDDDNLKLMESDYGRTWRCWARRPTDEEREAAVWEVE